MLKNIFFFIFLSLILNSCANNGFFDSDKAPHPGKREIIFITRSDQKRPTANANLSRLSKPMKVNSWPNSNNFQSSLLQNLDYNDEFELSMVVNAGWNKDDNSLPPVVEQEFIYLFHGKVLSKYDLKTLEQIWSNNNLPNIETIGGSLVVRDGYVFLADGTGILRCFSTNTGDLIWEYQAANAIRATPFIKDGTIYFITIDNSVYAINIKSGTHQWVVLSSSQTVINSPVGNSITLAGNMVITSLTNGNIEFLDISSGEKITELAPTFTGDYLSNIAGGFTQPLLVNNGNLYFIDDRYQMNIFDPEAGEFKVRTSIPQAKYFWATNDYTYILSSNNMISALNNGDGNVVWQTDINLAKDDMLYPPMIINSKLILFSKRGLVYIYNLKNGDQQDILSLGKELLTAPIIVQNKLITIIGGGKLSVWN